MSQFVVVSRERHSAKRWRRPDQFRFAAGDALAPAIGAELSRLAPTTPLAFVEQAGQFELAAVLSLTPGKNMFVGPDGRWLGGYVPALYRAYPFRVQSREGADEAVLCVDEDSELVVDGERGGEAFFDLMAPVAGAEGDPGLSHRGRAQPPGDAARGLGVGRGWGHPALADHAEDAGGRAGDRRPASHRRGGAERAGRRRLSQAPRKPRRCRSPMCNCLSMGQLGVFAAARQGPSAAGAAARRGLPESLDSVFGLPADDMVRFE